MTSGAMRGFRFFMFSSLFRINSPTIAFPLVELARNSVYFEVITTFLGQIS